MYGLYSMTNIAPRVPLPADTLEKVDAIDYVFLKLQPADLDSKD